MKTPVMSIDKVFEVWNMTDLLTGSHGILPWLDVVIDAGEDRGESTAHSILRYRWYSTR